MDYKCAMGNNVAGDAQCTTHGFVQSFKMTATDILHTQSVENRKEKYNHHHVVQDPRGNMSNNTILSVWVQEILFSFSFLVCSF